MNLRRGTVFLILAWAVVLVSGYALTLFLASTLKVDYRDYGVVMSVLLWLEIVVNSGIPYAVQKFTASHRDRAYSILRSGFAVQIVAASVLYAMAFFLSPFLAKLFRGENLTSCFRIAFVNIFLYGFFHLVASFQNGLGRFERQAFLLSIFAIARMGFMMLFVFFTRSLVWAFWGNVAGAALGFGVAYLFIRGKWKGPVDDPRALIRFAAPSVLYSLAIALLLSVDFWFVSRILSKEAGAVYMASSQIARIPYFLVFGLSSTVLPAVAAAISAKNLKKVHHTIEQAIRFLLILSVPVSILGTLYRREVMVLLFPSWFVSGAPVLGMLIWGMTFLAFYVVFTTVINAAGRPSFSFFITMVIVVLDVVLNFFLVPRMGIRGGAISTTIALGVGVCIAAVAVRKVFRFRMRPEPFFRIGLASIIPLGAGLWIPVRGLWLIPVGAAAMALYGFVLFATKEIRKEEVTAFFESKGEPSETPVESIL